MKLLKQLSLFLAIIGLFITSSCQRDIDMLVPDNNGTGLILNPAPVQASLKGKVIDENNIAVAGAMVRSGNASTTTDSRGLFSFNNIQLDKYASVVTVEMNGYFKGIRTFSVTAGSGNFVKLKLIPKSLIGNVDASVGGPVTLPNGSIITLLPNSVVTRSSGQPYTGSIKVFAATIDPTAGDIAQIVPGSFQALGANNLRLILKSYGMMAVQLEGQFGELLQIANNKTAKLRFTIPSSLSSSAPSTIPLWSLDETDGLWKQEAQATKTGNYYEGDVTHFSFWNCDAGSNTIYLELTLNTADGPLPYTIVKITRVNNGGYSYGYTDSTGHVGGLVFSNEPLLLEVLGNCNEVVYTQNTGPFTQNTNLGNITVSIPQQYSLQITGNVVDCNNQPVTNGNAFIYWEGQLYTSPVLNGSFSTTVTRCSSSSAGVEITAEDNNAHQQSTTWTGTASTGIVNSGTLTACGITTEQYIHYTINGINYAYNSPADSLGQFRVQGATTAVFFGSNSASTVNIGINYPIAIGSGQQLAFLNSTYIESGNSNTISSTIPITITEYGNVGQFISGNFSGTLVGAAPANNTYNINFSFRIRRAF